MSYSNGLSFLESKTKVLELANEFGARVAICPQWNGRIMTSTCNGLDGDSYGLIDVHSIENPGESRDPYLFGGEDQFTLSPHGGPFSLFYKARHPAQPGQPFQGTFQDGIVIPTGFREGPFEVDSGISDNMIRMRRSISATNISGAKFDLNVVRTVRLLRSGDLKEFFPSAALVALEQPEVSFVSFETTNTLINAGAPFSRNSGLVSIRIRSMFNATPFSVMLVPFRRGDEDQLGPPVQLEFFGGAFHNRFHVFPNVAILRGDGFWRGQLGVSRRRAVSLCASLDFRAGVLSLVSFSLPEEPLSHDYMSNDYCEIRGESGSVVSDSEESEGNAEEKGIVGVGEKVRECDFLSTREYYIRNIAQKQNAAFLELLESPDFLTLDIDPVAGLTQEVLENDPYSGEVVRAYNHGPFRPGERVALPFFEFDTYSPARELKKGESLTHQQRTTHIYADAKTLQYLVKTLLDVDTTAVFNAVLS